MRSEAEQFERIPVRICEDAAMASNLVAAEIAALIRQREGSGQPLVLGLATGSTPIRLYRELIRLHREEGLSFKQVITFNLDEYLGLARTHPQSYHRFMREQLFDHIDIPADNINIPDGLVARKDAFEHCRDYEQRITAAGGIDMQILGIGRTGHIGFNEPGSARDSRTRMVTLDNLTRRDAARDFLGEDNVPRYALTMGVATILGARAIRLLAWGEGKASVIARAVEAEATESLPASLLQGHGDVRFLVDPAAAAELTRMRHPWRVGVLEWEPRRIRQAVLWLARSLDKPILKLTDEEYSEHGLADLLTSHGPAYDLNIRIFNETQHTITGWPGGKPNADDSHRPERAAPHPKRVLVFSPEPQDDVLCMGGTLNRLVRQAHDVRVVYQTSGNLAVPDDAALRAAELIVELGAAEEISLQAATREADFAARVKEQLEKKGDFDLDTPEIRRLKGLLRRGEARAACALCGLRPQQLTFLDLPFYEHGRYRQFQPDSADLERMKALLRDVRPHQIYATGALSDPSSLAALCYNLLTGALADLQDADWLADCRLWLYRGGGQEWEPHEIDMAVPLSPDELKRKLQAIYQHQTQRSQAAGAANKHRESWQQAEVCNRMTAETYDHLGLAEYEAMEAFKRGGAV